MTFDQNRGLARRACDHVTGLGIQSANVDYYTARTKSLSYEACVYTKVDAGMEEREAYSRCKSPKKWTVDRKVHGRYTALADGNYFEQPGIRQLQEKSPYYKAGGQNEVDMVADLALKVRAGNCGEMSSVAFKHVQKLRSKERISAPIDQIAFDLGGHDDHQIVVIGRTDADTRLDEPEKWGPEAVVCDPWEIALMSHRWKDIVPQDAILSYGVYVSRMLKHRIRCMFDKTNLSTHRLIHRD